MVIKKNISETFFRRIHPSTLPNPNTLFFSVMNKQNCLEQMKAMVRGMNIVEEDTTWIMPQNMLIAVIVNKNPQLAALLCELKNKTYNNGQHEINYAKYAGELIAVDKLLGFVGGSSKKSFSDGTTVLQLLKIACQEVYQDAKFFIKRDGATEHLKTHYGKDRTLWNKNTDSLLKKFEGTSFNQLYDEKKRVLDKDYVLGLRFKDSIDLKDSLKYPSVADVTNHMKKKLIELRAITPSATTAKTITAGEGVEGEASQASKKQRINNAEASSSKDNGVLVVVGVYLARTSSSRY